MFIYASIILQTLEKSRKYLVRTTTTSAKSAKSAKTTQYKQISRSLSSTSSNDSGPKLRQKQKPSIERYHMFLKLFGAMGLTWILELIAWIISQYTEEVPLALTIILNTPTVLQGVIIFLVFAIKPTVRKSLAEKFRNSKKRWSCGSNVTDVTNIGPAPFNNKRISGSIIKRHPKAVGEPVPIRNSVSYRPSSDLDFGASDSDPFDP